jgi:hypothetical protein
MKLKLAFPWTLCKPSIMRRSVAEGGTPLDLGDVCAFLEVTDAGGSPAARGLGGIEVNPVEGELHAGGPVLIWTSLRRAFHGLLIMQIWSARTFGRYFWPLAARKPAVLFPENGR